MARRFWHLSMNRYLRYLNDNKRAPIFLCAITISLLWMWYFSYFSILLYLAAIMFILALWRIKASAIVILIFSPFLIAAIYYSAGAIRDYNAGTAYLMCRGLPKTEHLSITYDSRLRKTFSCLIYPTDFFTVDVYNAVLLKLVDRNGIMAGSYMGPFPKRAEVYRLLRQEGIITSCRMEDTTIIAIGDFFIKGEPDKINRLFMSLERMLNETLDCRYVLLNHSALLIGNPRLNEDADVFLIDINNCEIVALFVTEDYDSPQALLP